jgi:hypothetical protein
MTPGEAVGQFVWIDAGNLPLTFTVSKYIEAAGHTLKWLGADPRAEVHEHACAAYERDLYVYFESGRPVSVEDAINRRDPHFTE